MLCLPAPSKDRKPGALPGTHCSTKGTSRSATRSKKSSGIWRFSAICWMEKCFTKLCLLLNSLNLVPIWNERQFSTQNDRTTYITIYRNATWRVLKYSVQAFFMQCYFYFSLYNTWENKTEQKRLWLNEQFFSSTINQLKCGDFKRAKYSNIKISQPSSFAKHLFLWDRSRANRRNGNENCVAIILTYIWQLEF